MQVEIAPRAQAEFEELPATVKERVVGVFARLAQWPQVSGVKGLTGNWAGHARIRVGDYRVIFHLIGRERLVVDRIAHRREVYD